MLLPASVLRGLTEAEMTVYRRPFLEPGESRRPTLSWPRNIPIEGEPAEVVALVEDYGRWLAGTSVVCQRVGRAVAAALSKGAGQSESRPTRSVVTLISGQPWTMP